MKYIKFAIGLIGSIFIVPILVTCLVIVVIVLNFIFNLVFFHALAVLVSWLFVGFIIIIITVVGYQEVIGFLERHFKYFKKD